MARQPTGSKPPEVVRLIPRPHTTERILAGARDLLAEGGIEGFTVPRVAERAGVARATVYNHFRSRDELVLRLLRTAMDRATVSVSAADTNQARAGAVAHAMVVAFSEVIGSPAASMSALTSTDKQLQHLQTEISVELTERFRAALSLEKDEVAATALMWSTVGLLLRASYGEIEIRDLRGRISTMTDVVLTGLT